MSIEYIILFGGIIAILVIVVRMLEKRIDRIDDEKECLRMWIADNELAIEELRRKYTGLYNAIKALEKHLGVELTHVDELKYTKVPK